MNGDISAPLRLHRLQLQRTAGVVGVSTSKVTVPQWHEPW